MPPNQFPTPTPGQPEQPYQPPQPNQQPPQQPYTPPSPAAQGPGPAAPQQPYYHNPAQPPYPQQGPGGQPPYQRQEDPGLIYGIIGIVLAIIGLSLIGIIVSFIGNKQSKAAGFKSGISLIALWINIVFTVIATLAIVGFIALAIMSPQSFEDTSSSSSSPYNSTYDSSGNSTPRTNEL